MLEAVVARLGEHLGGGGQHGVADAGAAGHRAPLADRAGSRTSCDDINATGVALGSSRAQTLDATQVAITTSEGPA